MDAGVSAIIQSMATTSLAFVGDIITNFWGLILSFAFLAAIAGYIMNKARVAG